MMALRIAITTTISTAPIGRSITMDGTSHCVTRNEITETTRTMIRRLISAAGPPRHSRSTLIWVRYRSSRLMAPPLAADAATGPSHRR